MPDEQRAALDGHGIVVVVVFAIVSFLCIFPVYIPLPMVVSRPLRRLALRMYTALDIPRADEGKRDPLDQASVGGEKGASSATSVSDDLGSEPAPSVSTADNKRVWLPLTHTTAPVIGVLLLLATTSIGGAEVRKGIAGDSAVYPYDVLALFLSLAYIAISLDTTGLLRFLACHVCQRAAFDGRVLYIFLYLFLWIAGVVLGNDPVILSGTAFLVYITRVAGITPPSAWIWAQFVAANVASAVLVSSNPTNLVIASGFEVSFVEYTAYMVLPSFVAAIVALATLMVYFRTTRLPSDKAEHIPMQRFTTALARLNGSVTDDRRVYVFIPHKIHSPDIQPRLLLADPFGAIFCSVVMLAVLGTLIGTSVMGEVKVYQIGVPGAVLCFLRDLIADIGAYRKSTAPATQQGPVRRMVRIFPATSATLRRLPLDLVPFAFGMFILVQGLSHVGFVTIMAKGVVRVCAHGAAATTFFMSFLSMVLCNVRIATHPVWRHEYRRDDSPDQGHAEPCVHRRSGRGTARAGHQGWHVLGRVWLQYGRTGRDVCRESCGPAMARLARAPPHPCASRAIPRLVPRDPIPCGGGRTRRAARRGGLFSCR